MNKKFLILPVLIAALAFSGCTSTTSTTSTSTVPTTAVTTETTAQATAASADTTAIATEAATAVTASDTVTVQKAAWSEKLKSSAALFSTWIQTESGKSITTSVLTFSGNIVFTLVPDNVLSASTKLTLADEMYGFAVMFRSLQTGTLTSSQLDAAIKSFGPNISSAQYSAYFSIFNVALKSATSKLQGYGVALNTLLECAAVAAETCAGSYRASHTAQ